MPWISSQLFYNPRKGNFSFHHINCAVIFYVIYFYIWAEKIPTFSPGKNMSDASTIDTSIHGCGLKLYSYFYPLQVIHTKEALRCLNCMDRDRSVAVLPCQHLVFCESCSPTKNECPVCHIQITTKVSVLVPLWSGLGYAGCRNSLVLLWYYYGIIKWH